VTDDTEEPDLISIYERGAALRERLRIAQILEFGMATGRMTSAMGLAFRTNVPVGLACELMELLVSDTDLLRQRVLKSDDKFLKVVA
jgi:hypothetical protein